MRLIRNAPSDFFLRYYPLLRRLPQSRTTPSPPLIVLKDWLSSNINFHQHEIVFKKVISLFTTRPPLRRGFKPLFWPTSERRTSRLPSKSSHTTKPPPGGTPVPRQRQDPPQPLLPVTYFTRQLPTRLSAPFPPWAHPLLPTARSPKAACGRSAFSLFPRWA